MHEIMANLYGLTKNPIGFIATLIWSFSPSRLGIYFQRLKSEEKVNEIFKEKLYEYLN